MRSVDDIKSMIADLIGDEAAGAPPNSSGGVQVTIINFGNNKLVIQGEPTDRNPDQGGKEDG